MHVFGDVDEGRDTVLGRGVEEEGFCEGVGGLEAVLFGPFSFVWEWEVRHVDRVRSVGEQVLWIVDCGLWYLGLRVLMEEWVKSVQCQRWVG